LVGYGANTKRKILQNSFAKQGFKVFDKDRKFMKNILFVLLGLLIYPALVDVAELVDDRFDTKLWIEVGIPSYGLSLGLTGRCTEHVRPNNGVTNRKYFDCGKINIAISDLLYK
jgi:hypothetical protein